MLSKLLALLTALFSAGLLYGQSVPTVYQSLYNQLYTLDCVAPGSACTPVVWPNPPGAAYVGVGDLPDFQSYVAVLPGSSTPGPNIMVGQITAANANAGPAMLLPSNWPIVMQQILIWKATGAQGVSLEISFPMLNQSFLDGASKGYYAQFSAFYAAVAAAIRAQGMKVIVESQGMLNQGGLASNQWSTLPGFYVSIPTFNGGAGSYVSLRAATVANVINIVKPDYFVMQEEPDTEAQQACAGNTMGCTFAPLQTVAGSTTMLSASVTSARTAISGLGLTGQILIGAGFGTWLQAYQTFANSFTIAPGCSPCIGSPLDFLDMHVFPVDEQTALCAPNGGPVCTAPQFWVNATNTAATAKAQSLPITISQAWLRKVTNAEWLQNPAGTCDGGPCRIGDIEEARETYSFWGATSGGLPYGLDNLFFSILRGLANYANAIFVVPFNTQNLTAAIPWSTTSVPGFPSGTVLYPDGDGVCTPPCGTITPTALFSSMLTVSRINAAKANYTNTAQGLHQIWAPGDVTAPTTPTGVLPIWTSPTAISVAWNFSTDNVGVAGYHVTRILGGTPTVLPDTLVPPIYDSALTANAAYSYKVQAFDLAGNTSAFSLTVPVITEKIGTAGTAKLSGTARM